MRCFHSKRCLGFVACSQIVCTVSLISEIGQSSLLQLLHIKCWTLECKFTLLTLLEGAVCLYHNEIVSLHRIICPHLGSLYESLELYAKGHTKSSVKFCFFYFTVIINSEYFCLRSRFWCRSVLTGYGKCRAELSWLILSRDPMRKDLAVASLWGPGLFPCMRMWGLLAFSVLNGVRSFASSYKTPLGGLIYQ